MTQDIKGPEDALKEATKLVEPYIVGKKHVQIRVAALRYILAALQSSSRREEAAVGALREAGLRLSSALLSGHTPIMIGEVRATRDAINTALQAVEGGEGE